LFGDVWVARFSWQDEEVTMRGSALRRFKLKRQFKQVKRLPLFPFVPFVPAAIFLASLATSIRALVRVRRLERLISSPT
jgi:hypothetical protein